jgi:hypothetical protein
MGHGLTTATRCSPSARRPGTAFGVVLDDNLRSIDQALERAGLGWRVRQGDVLVVRRPAWRDDFGRTNGPELGPAETAGGSPSPSSYGSHIAAHRAAGGLGAAMRLSVRWRASRRRRGFGARRNTARAGRRSYGAMSAHGVRGLPLRACARGRARRNVWWSRTASFLLPGGLRV